MPKSQVTKVTVSQVWDDNSSTDVEISMVGREKDQPFVALTTSGETVGIHPESWVEIRDQIESMMDEIALDREDG